MAQRAAARHVVEVQRQTADARRRLDEAMATATDVDLYEGPCDVCGGLFSVRHSYTVSGDIYSSRVYRRGPQP